MKQSDPRFVLKKSSAYQLVIVILLLGLALACYAYTTTNNQIIKEAEQNFENQLANKAVGLNSVFFAIEKILVSTSQLVVLQPQLDRRQYSQFVNSTLLQKSALNGVLWVPVIPLNQTQQFVQTARKNGQFDYQLRAMQSAAPCPAEAALAHYPVYLAAPEENVGTYAGIDLSSSCDIRKLLDAKQSDSGILSFNITDELGTTYTAIAVKAERNHQLIGYLVGLIEPKNLIDNIFPELTAGQQYRLQIFASPQQRRTIYDSDWRSTSIQTQHQTDSAKIEAYRTIPFANQLLYVIYSTYQDKLSASWTPIWLASLIVLAAILMATYIFSSLNRLRWVTSVVERQTKSLSYQATHDALTGLRNKQSLIDGLTSPIHASHKGFKPFSLMFIDLDKFKEVNDTAGHIVGDKLLKMAAQRLTNASRRSDQLFRFGGDEFIIILNGLVELETIKQRSDHYLSLLLKPFSIDGQAYQIGASIGVCRIVKPFHKGEEILRDADIAMYQAKEQGRGRTVFFDESMFEEIMVRHKLETELKTAIENNQFRLFMQPIFDQHLELAGFEALIRWQHPEKGIISPAQFIPLAEKNGAITDIGEFVLRKAVKELSLWLTQIPEDVCPYISINVSVLELNENYVETAEQVLKEFQVPPNLLAIELTETVFAEDNNHLKACLEQANKVGIRLFLDDFGTGYSSLARLQILPLDVVKIDRSFISALRENSAESKDFINAIIEMAHVLNLDVVAEGIETLSIRDWLIANRCNYLQGFLLSEPIPQEKALAYIEESRLRRQANIKLV